MSRQSPHAFNFIDVFAGCGGLSLGLLQSGWNGILAIEKDTNAFATLRKNLLSPDGIYKFSWPDWIAESNHDIETLLNDHYEKLLTIADKIDLVVGGPPCQGFSSAGKRISNDPRNKLVGQYLKFVDIIKPKIILIENVRGITSEFLDVTQSDGKIRYSDWITEVLSQNYIVFSDIIDTSLFGVPQKRHRFFIIAIRKDLSILDNANPFSLLESGRQQFLNTKNIRAVPLASKSAISDLEIGRNGKQTSTDSVGFEEIRYREPLTSYQILMHGELGSSISNTRLARHKPHIEKRFRKIIDICHLDGRLNVSLSKDMKESFGLKKTAIRVLDPDNPSPTITSMPDDLLHYQEARTLTVRENARLQSFPDWFDFQGKYTSGGNRRKNEVPRFTQVANAVPPLMAEAIGICLKNILKDVQMVQKAVETNHPKDFVDQPSIT